MGFFAELGQMFKKALTGVVQAGHQLLQAAEPVARKVKEKAREVLEHLERVWEKATREDPASERAVVERHLQDINERLARLRRTYDARHLTPSEIEEVRSLKRRRKDLLAELEAFDAADLAEDLDDDEQTFEPHTVTDADAHLIDMVAGQSTYGKTCPRHNCGRSMVLQWDRKVVTPALADFYWGCSGWYVVLQGDRRACYHTERLARADLDIFANVERPEFAVTAAELTRRVMDPGKRNRIRTALDAIRGQHRDSGRGMAQYRCPVHGETLRLQRKHAATDSLLDEYFLGCPRWLPANAGCNFLLKLKSPARVSAVMEAGVGQGALMALEG